MATSLESGNFSRSQGLATGHVRLSLRMLRVHQMCDDASGRLFFVAAIFSPWAFGTTQLWAVWVMNILGYTLGILLAVKLGIRLLTGYENARWGSGGRRTRFFTRTLAGLTVMILFYCLVSALNARSTYNRDESSFEYYNKFIDWLPHSYDRNSTWLAFCNYLAMACSFWALRDWLLGKSPAEERADRSAAEGVGDPRPNTLPERLRRLLWVLTISGGLLGVEGIVQRLDGTGKLLFLVQPKVNREAESQFGPYAYRSNATQYFNLLWPASLALWWALKSAGEGGSRYSTKARRRHRWILVCVAVMAACPLLSTSRAGAIVALINLLAAAAILGSEREQQGRGTRRAILTALGAALIGGTILGWNSLAPRFTAGALREGFTLRNFMYEQAGQMAEEYPLFGTGPGTFEPLFQMYRIDPDEYWPAQLHNDWLETRITFGWVGSLLIAAAGCFTLTRWFVPGGIRTGGRFVMLLWVAIAGCLFHARYDFPFQVYSIIFLFLILCAILASVSQRRLR